MEFGATSVSRAQTPSQYRVLSLFRLYTDRKVAVARDRKEPMPGETKVINASPRFPPRFVTGQPHVLAPVSAEKRWVIGAPGPWHRSNVSASGSGISGCYADSLPMLAHTLAELQTHCPRHPMINSSGSLTSVSYHLIS
jgi:hypothetical protein